MAVTPSAPAGKMVVVDMDTIADDLYTLTPSEFIAARDSRAADARRAGDRDTAAAIKRLRRPTLSAWLANVLVHERPDQMNRLLDIGAAMRDAQNRLAVADLRGLSAQRHEAVASLLAEARGLAARRGQEVGEPAMRELEATLDAGLADADAAGALRGGRLTGALHYSGFGSVELTSGASAAEVTAIEPPEQRPPRRRGGKQARPGAKEEAALEAARRSLDEARASVSAAERQLRKAQHDEARAQAALRSLLGQPEGQA